MQAVHAFHSQATMHAFRHRPIGNDPPPVETAPQVTQVPFFPERSPQPTPATEPKPVEVKIEYGRLKTGDHVRCQPIFVSKSTLSPFSHVQQVIIRLPRRFALVSSVVQLYRDAGQIIPTLEGGAMDNTQQFILETALAGTQLAQHHFGSPPIRHVLQSISKHAPAPPRLSGEPVSAE